MFSKLASLVLLVALVAAAPQHSQQPLPASQFPAGVNPALCPGFPICDNALLHNPQAAVQQQAQSGQWNPHAQPQQAQWNNPAPAVQQWNPTPAAPKWNQPTPAAPQWNTPGPVPSWNSAPDNGQWNPPATPDNGQWNPPATPDNGQWNPPATPAPYYPTAPAQNWNAPTPASSYQPSQPSYDGPSSNDVDSTGGDKYPAGINPKTCPNYPYCDSPLLGAGGASAYHAAPLPGFTDKLYPAGVSAQQCPNFPYCS